MKKSLYIKYFVVFTSVLLVCITFAGVLMMMILDQNAKTEKLASLMNAVMDISAYSVAQSEQIFGIFESATLEYKREHELDRDYKLNEFDTILIMEKITDDVSLRLNNIRDNINMRASIMNADFYMVSTPSGRVTVCKEMLNGETSEGCPIHSGMIIDSDTLFRAADPKKRSYLGTLNGIYGESHFICIYPVTFNGNDIAFIFGTQPVSSALAPLRAQLFKKLLLSCVIALLLSLLTVFLLTYSMLKPIKEISAATRRYAKGDFSYRVPVRGNNEMSELTVAFNSMANSLALIESSRRSFVANVSHELKTPMTSIGGFVDGILDGTISDSHEQKRYLSIVSDEVRRLSRLISSMLNMSKIEAGEMELVRKSYNLTDQIIKCLLSFEKLISDKGIRILGLDAMENVAVYADEDMINQVVYNLIDNAVKFTPAGGTISFEAFTKNHEAVAKIKNSGVGIDEDDLRKVFERFYKADKSRSLDTKSVGLGLYIVKSIIELHDGYISVSSGDGNRGHEPRGRDPESDYTAERHGIMPAEINDAFVEFMFRIPLS